MADHNEAMRLADPELLALYRRHELATAGLVLSDFRRIVADILSVTVSKQAERIAELEKELQATSEKLQDLQSLFDYVKERRAQISHRLWVWAHEELNEPLKTRYFNIVANGTADLMEQPTYAQQYNAQKHRAEAAEAERDQLREEVEMLRANAERYVYLRNRQPSDVIGQTGPDAGCWIDCDDSNGELVLLTGEDADDAIDKLRTKP